MKILGPFLFLSLVVLCLNAWNTGTAMDCNEITTVSLGRINPPNAESLRETHERQSRWLSLPKSRVVLNPYNFLQRTVPVETCPDTALPLNAGVYAGGTALWLNKLLMLYSYREGAAAAVEAGWTDDLRVSEDAWSGGSNTTAEQVGKSLRLTVHGPMKGCPACGAAERWLEVDLDRYPWLEVTVDTVGDAWALKVADELTTREVLLQHDTTTTGTFTYNVAEAARWQGTRKFAVRFYVIGKNLPGTLSNLRFLGFEEPQRVEAVSCRTKWAPHVLRSQATYNQGGKVATTDAFADTETVVREFRFEDHAAGAWSLTGQYKGIPSWDGSAGVLTVEGTTLTYAIAFRGGLKGSKISYYPTEVDLYAGSEARKRPFAEAGFWALDLEPGVQSSSSLICSVAFTPKDATPTAPRKAVKALAREPGEILAQQRDWWDRYLASVPHPANFELASNMLPLGVTAEDVRAAYYKAWVFLGANSLPIMPETGYNYPQIPAGKPSMWLEGHPMARPTASWDSLFAMQFQAYTEPELAWKAFEGLMTLVDPDGRLGGESLPSRKAQTAFILHQVANETEKLRGIYPALKRHLLWERQNPRWIHKEHDYEDEKDADFVVSLIIDMRHMAKIAEVLKQPDEQKFWLDEAEKLFADYRQWFWETPESDPVQTYFTGSGRRREGNGLWVLSGLALPDLQDDKDRLDGMMRLFRRIYAPDRTFTNFFLPKYPEIQFVVTGLHAAGLKQEAALIANVAIRDVTRSNMFAEQYDIADFPNPDGVRPSAFGAGMLIDMLWMKNGYRMDQGKPMTIDLHGECGGITNLRVRDEVLRVLHRPGAEPVITRKPSGSSME